MMASRSATTLSRIRSALVSMPMSRCFFWPGVCPGLHPGVCRGVDPRLDPGVLSGA